MRSENLDDLVRSLDGRKRLLNLLAAATDALTASLAVSLLVVLAVALFDWEISLGRLLLLINGGGVAAVLLVTAFTSQDHVRLLIEADRAYELKELLVSGHEFASREDRLEGSESDPESAFRNLVVERAEEKSLGVDPTVVFPASLPRRTPLLAAMVVGFGVLMILYSSGWFERPVPPLLESGLLVEETGRRLAERAPENEELQALADEMRRLGDRMRRNEITAEEARRRIEQLGERVEEQLRNLERTPEFETGEEAEMPPETESAVRQALQSGMSESEVMEFFTRMRSEGNTLPDVVESLEEATRDMEPNANLGLDEERLQNLMDQLNRSPAEDSNSDLVENLEEAQRSLQSSPGQGLADLSEGDPGDPGSMEDSGVSRGAAPMEGQPSGEPMESGEQGPESFGQQAGDVPVDDQMDDDYQRPENSNPIFREIEGMITDNTIMDIIIRELPAEATSNLTEEERDVAVERVIEEAVGREDTPPDLQRLVRNYFLRVTLAAEEGEEDEQ